MAFDRLAFLGVLEDSYAAYYNIIKENLPEEFPIAFRADFYKRDERYWLTKSVKYYGNETNEFVYVFSADSFSRENAPHLTGAPANNISGHHVSSNSLTSADTVCFASP